MRIQHNIMAMNAYRNYTNNVSAMKSNLEKLSSGYKINRAGDDAAGLAISEKMRAQITGLETAQKNAKDGISLVQTAEGALTEVHDMLNRMVTLATQSANGTYDNSVDRNQMQKELDQLRSEINRIADSSNFNGINLLKGEVGLSGAEDVAVTVLADGQLGKDPQAGIYSIDFSNVKVKGDATGGTLSLTLFGASAMDYTVDANSTLEGAELAQEFADLWNESNTGNWTDTHGFTMEASVEGNKLVFTMSDAPTAALPSTFGDAAAAGKFVYNAVANVNGNNAEQVHLTVEQEAVDSTKSRMYGQASFTLDKTAGAGKVLVEDGSAVTIGNETYVFAVGSDSKYKDMENVVDLTDKTMDSTDLIATAGQRLSNVAKDNDMFKVGTTVKDGTIAITEKEGAINYSKNNLAGKDGKGTKGISGTADATATDWGGLVKTGKAVAQGTSLTLQIGDTADDFNQLKVTIGDCHTSAMGIADISIADQEDAQAAVDVIKQAINYVSDIRGDLGATQNRLDHTINNLSVMTENIQDAESTIRDVDVAEEMMAYTKNNILIQSAQAMLAQANQVPQGVLQLLG